MGGMFEVAPCPDAPEAPMPVSECNCCAPKPIGMPIRGGSMMRHA